MSPIPWLVSNQYREDFKNAMLKQNNSINDNKLGENYNEDNDDHSLMEYETSFNNQVTNGNPNYDFMNRNTRHNSYYRKKMPYNNTIYTKASSLKYASSSYNNHKNKSLKKTCFLHRRKKTPDRLWDSLQFKAKEFKRILPKVHDINIIDKYSRLIFPILFLFFNLCYWIFYFVQNTYVLTKNSLHM